MPSPITYIDGQQAVDPERAIARARIFVALIDPSWWTNSVCQRQFQIAVNLGKPLRLLLAPGTRLPETFALGARDVAVFSLSVLPNGRYDMVAATDWLADELDRLPLPQKEQRR